jgi:predicted amidohydrolase YtcJ
MRSLSLAAVSGLALLFCGPTLAADLLIHGGPIHTGVAAAPTAEAVVVRADRIAFVGPLAEARRRAGAGARDIDLKGAAAYPGFVDGHVHLTGVGLREMTLNLEGTPSVAGLIEAVRAYAAANPGTTPITGRGWIETHWPEKRFPTREDLDRAAPGRVVVLGRADGHALVASSAALALGGITRDTPDPDGGRILKDARGEPDGMLIDNAQGLVRSKLPGTTPAQVREAVQKGAALYASRGWTGVDNMSASTTDLVAMQSLAAAGALPIRVDNYMDPRSADEVLTNGPSVDPTGRVWVRGIKMYADGALGSRGAALLAPYSDAPETSGLLVMRPEEMAPYLIRALRSGAQVATHAIGDRGNRLTLDGYAKAFTADRDAGRNTRWRIEHAQILSPADLARFAKMGVIASMQPSHAIGDLYFAPARLGPDRLKGAYAWRDLIDSGATLVAGTDAPVEKGDPLIEFYAAAVRKDLAGKAGPDWHPEERVNRAEALRMLTLAPAFATFREAELGTLEVGKRADLTILSKDIMTVPDPEILTARPVMTVVDGEVVFEAR